MTPRDTRTGVVLEAMIIPALERGGYKWEKQVTVGTRPNGKQHKVDVVAYSNTGEKYLISLKWQQTSGTAEQKVPFEVICLADVILNCKGKYTKAYLVLGDEGWTLREFYISRYIFPGSSWGIQTTIGRIVDFVSYGEKPEGYPGAVAPFGHKDDCKPLLPCYPQDKEKSCL